MNTVPAENEQPKDAPISAESVVMRYNPALMSAAREYLQTHEAGGKHDIESEDVSFFAEFMKAVDLAGVKNYELHTPAEFPGVVIPFTRVNLNELYEKLVGQPAPGAEQLPAEKRVLFQSFNLSSDRGHFADMWGEIYRQAAYGISKIASAQAQGEEIPDMEIISMGSAHGFGGKTTLEWLRAVRKQGFDHYGKQFAQFVQEKVLGDQEKLKLTLGGYSGGTQYAYRTAEVLEQRQLSGLELKTVMLNPAGFHERKLLEQLVAALKMPVGLFGTVGWLFLLGSMGKDPLFMEEQAADAPFKENLQRYLGNKFIPATPEMRKLNFMVSLAEGKHLLMGSPYSDILKNKATEIKGAMDPVSLDFESMGLLKKPVNIVPASGTKPRRFVLGKGSHYIDYNDLRVRTFLRQMHSVRTLQKYSTHSQG